jgi:cold shock CspA family protein
MTGVVTAILSEKRFGFIRDESGQDVFFHIVDCNGDHFDDLVVGTPVEFTVYQHEGDARFRARNIYIYYPEQETP